MTPTMKARMQRIRLARARLLRAQNELMKFAFMLNQMTRTAMNTQGIYPDEELLGEIQDMHYWLLHNYRMDIFGNLVDFVHIEPGQIGLTPVRVQNPNQLGVNNL